MNTPSTESNSSPTNNWRTITGRNFNLGLNWFNLNGTAFVFPRAQFAEQIFATESGRQDYLSLPIRLFPPYYSLFKFLTDLMNVFFSVGICLSLVECFHLV